MTLLVLLFKAPCLSVAYQTMTSSGMASDFHILSSIPIFYTSPETLKSPKMATLSSNFTVGGISNEAHQIALLILTLILSICKTTKMNMIETDYFKGI